MKQIINDRNKRRKLRISKNIKGKEKVPRISVFSSNKYTYAQFIDDVNRRTIFAFSTLSLSKEQGYSKSKKTADAKKAGIELAKKAKEKGIEKGIFDRGKYSYKGRIRALADGLREGGLLI